MKKCFLIICAFLVSLGLLSGCSYLSKISEKIPPTTYIVNAGKTAAYLLYTSDLYMGEGISSNISAIVDTTLTHLPEALTVDTLTNELHNIIIKNINVDTNVINNAIFVKITDLFCSIIDSSVKKLVSKYPDEFTDASKIYDVTYLFIKSFKTQLESLNSDLLNPKSVLAKNVSSKNTYAKAEQLVNLSGGTIDEDVFNDIYPTLIKLFND